MIAHSSSPYILGVMLLACQAAPPGSKSEVRPPARPPAEKSPEDRFEELLASAMKDPARADWIALRQTFAQTSFYHPYNPEWRTELGVVRKDMAADRLPAAEKALVALLERERYMRIDAIAMAAALYERMGDKAKARKHRDFLEGMTGAVFIPRRGMSIERPIDVLYVDEEYFVLGSLRLRPKAQSLREQNGHRFDVFTIPAVRDRPELEIYFNIDLPYNALGRELMKASGDLKEPEAKQ